MTTYLLVFLGLCCISPISTSSMGPPESPGTKREERNSEEWMWHSSEAEGSQEESISVPEKENPSNGKDIAESRSILTTLLSPFTGSRVRGSQRGSFKTREQSPMARRPFQPFQHNRFVPVGPTRFRPKGVRGRINTPSQQPHIFQPILAAPVSINFPLQDEHKQTSQDTNSYSHENYREDNETPNNHKEVQVGHDTNEIPKVREQSHFSVISSRQPIVAPPKHHQEPSSGDIQSSPYSLFKNSQGSPYSAGIQSQPRPPPTPAPSIRFSSYSNDPLGTHGFNSPTPIRVNGNSLTNNVRQKNNELNGFISSNNVDDIRSSVNVGNQFQKPFGSTPNSFGFAGDQSFSTQRPPPSITYHVESKEIPAEPQNLNSYAYTTNDPHTFQTPHIPKTTPSPITVSFSPHSSPQNPQTFPTTETPIVFATGQPLKSSSHFQVQHVKGSTPNQIPVTSEPNYQPQPFLTSQHNTQGTQSPQFQTQEIPTTFHESSSPNPIQDHHTVAIKYHTQITTDPRYVSPSTQSPTFHQKLTQPPKHQYRTTPSRQYNTHSQPQSQRQYQRVSKPEVKSHTQGFTAQTEHSPPQSSSVRTIESYTENPLNSWKQNQVNSNSNNLGFTANSIDGFLPFRDSNAFFNHIFGEENPFGNKIYELNSTEESSVRGLNSQGQQNNQIHQSNSISPLNRPKKQVTLSNTISPGNTEEIQPFFDHQSNSAIGHNNQPRPGNSQFFQSPHQQQHFRNQFPVTNRPVEPFTSSSKVFVTSQQASPEFQFNHTPDAWSRFDQPNFAEQHSGVTEQNTGVNTDPPIRILEPFTNAEGGANPYTTHKPVQALQTAHQAQPASQTRDNLQTQEKDKPSTISATTIIDDKEFEVLVLPYEKQTANTNNARGQKAPKSPLVLAPPQSVTQKPFRAGLPLQPAEEEVSVYLVRHRKPSTPSGNSPTPPTTPKSLVASTDDGSVQNTDNIDHQEGTVASGLNEFGHDAVAFPGFPVPVDLNQGQVGAQPLSSQSKLSGTAVTPGGRLFKFDYQDRGSLGSVVPATLEGSFTHHSVQTNRGIESSTDDRTARDQEDPDEYVQVLGLLAPPPGVVCKHGICADEKEFQQK